MSPSSFSTLGLEGHEVDAGDGAGGGLACGRYWLNRFETAGCVRDLILSSCSLQVSSFLFRSFSSVEILVLAMVSSLLRNSIWTDSGLGFGFGLLFFWVEG